MKIREYLHEFDIDFTEFIKSIQEEIDREILEELISETTVSGNVGTYDVPYADKKKKGYVRVDIPPTQRSFKNLPRYANKKPKVKFQDWLELDSTGFGKHGASGGKSPNGKYYGYSHRAICGFKKGDEIKSTDNMSHDSKRKCPYCIKSNKDAMKHAIRFSRAVS